VTPGPRLPALARNRIVYRDGVPVAAREGGEVRWLADLDAAAASQAAGALARRSAR
jgi:ATP-dependent Lhr-like helicase